MKKIGGILIATCMLTVLFLVSPAVPAQAAACANVSTFGAVSLQLPTLPKKGEYLVWVRLQGPGSTAKVLVELNGSDCLEISGTGLQADSWSWQAYRTGGQPQTVTLTATEGNSIKVIGTQDGVKIDRVLLTVPGCTPEEFGDNCAETFEAKASDTGDIRTLPPPSNEAVSGKVVLSNTPFTSGSELSRLDYSAGGRTLQSSEQAEPFDTTRLSNGKHTILIETTLSSGQVIRESTVITVDNPENVISPLVRWIRQRQRSLSVVVLAAGAVSGAAVLIIMLRRVYLQRRERRFHGF